MPFSGLDSIRKKVDQISSSTQPASHAQSTPSRWGSLSGSSGVGGAIGNLGILSPSKCQRQTSNRGLPSDPVVPPDNSRGGYAPSPVSQPQAFPPPCSTSFVAPRSGQLNTRSPVEHVTSAQPLSANHYSHGETFTSPSGNGVQTYENTGSSANLTPTVHQTQPVAPVYPSQVQEQLTRPKSENKWGSMNIPKIPRRDRSAAAMTGTEQDSSTQMALEDDTTTQSSSKPKEPGFKLKIPKSLRGVANLSELDIDLSGGDISIVSDTKKAQRKEGLCTTCSKINWEQFDPRNPAASASTATKFTHKLVFLDRILRKKRKNNCHFCCLIFDAIAENDPFEHPAVKDSLPKELVGMTFRQWAEGLNMLERVPIYKTAYPFGRSRDKTALEHKVQGDEVLVVGSTDKDELNSDDVIKTGSVAATVGVTTAMWTETDTERVKIMATVGTVIPTITSFMTNLDSKLPVAVSIIVHNVGHADEGLLNVDVWGYGNAHRAPLSRISTFNLRIASGYQSSLGGNLKYGKLLQPEVDVEGDCKLWLENCCEHHGESCDEPSGWNELQPPSGPHFRLIDVNAMRIVQKDMLSLGDQGKLKYAALSYVWGTEGRRCLNLHVRNLEALSSRLEGYSIPIAKTIRDAIDVTRRMGLQYIWVDSLCIVQHDEFGEDYPSARLSQIEQMDRIFGHAVVTIVAADGLDAGAGLTGISTKAPRTQIAREIQPNVNVLLAVQYNLSLGKWDTRAWTLQEKLLSKRMLVFNGGYVSFHCRHGVLREDMPALHAGNGPAQIPWVSLPEKTPDSLIKHTWDGTPVLLRSPFFSEYANLLAQYTSRDMTDSRDALNAVLGLLKVLERISNSSRAPERPVSLDLEQASPSAYTLHGLPEKFLDLALLWQPPAAKGVHLTKRPHEDLPSWSWIGWEVSKDPDYLADAGNAYLAKPGVRFEEPFLVSTNDDLSLKKVVAREEASLKKIGTIEKSDEPPEERFKPLIMWYKAHKPSPDAPVSLLPVNGHGMGLALGPSDANELYKFQEDALRLRTTASHTPPAIHHSVPLDTRHLVCETEVARFRLRRATPRTEMLWKRTDKGLVIDSELTIPEAEVLDAAGAVVGRVIPTDQRRGLASGLYDFILLSESQYWGNEKRVDVSGLPLFNVMFVEWDTRREFATRVGVGKVMKRAWWDANPSKQVVILK
jgi:heterokaryon incompatibility protein (HET)